ncbi:MAG: hypothetical protein CM15mP86_08850 [Gammaproteobacteria bacterium]|nr:MAG: hypothetical protein CM15mP86_08850 [Gammaproteobacteria bacterium]
MKLREKKLLGAGTLIMFVKAMQRPQKFLVSSCGFVAPKSFLPENRESYENVKFTSSLKEATKDSDIVTTDVWISMGDESESTKRKDAFSSYQVNEKVLDEASSDVIFLHCLPAKRGQEISENLLNDPRSRVWNQAENRLHAQKVFF